ncbi:acyltransferase [Treponema sp. Marseille-Q4130]|nr:acyltransferase [Treponema sp. Marseille-Q4130]MBC6719182.1 acyltransferase [Treponema sp. Marseille-Q4130]
MYERAVLLCKTVLIKRDTWIGAGATILPGVCAGKHAVVGAGSVVTKDVPDYAVVVGSPARIVKTLDADKFKE